MYRTTIALTTSMSLALVACGGQDAATPGTDADIAAAEHAVERLAIYAPVRLTADLSGLSDGQRAMLVELIRASEIMDGLFWYNAYGDKDVLLGALDDPALREFARINYGPWDRLDGNRPFVPGYGEKPLGANFYPPDMTKVEFEAWEQEGKSGLYSYVRRDDSGALTLVPYSVMHAEELAIAAAHLRAAAELAEDPGFKDYLELRAQALVSDDYQPSDMAWMDMKSNRIDVVIGPIETYEDRLYGYRAAFESYVLVKDMAWSERLARFAAFLPELQRGLPVPDVYKRETPGSDADLNAYDVIYYAGDSSAGSKTIAINLPNDEQVQLAKGTRRLQLKNAMRAKFDKILVPIAEELVAEDLRGHITFNAFFSNVMFHEVAHGLGIKNTIDGSGTVREALLEHTSPFEEAKADVLGLYMITRLFEQGELHEGEVLDHYVTFMAGLFRSVRFGASSAHGRANMVQFNFFTDRGAFSRGEDGAYRVNFEAMKGAVEALAGRILVMQGDGDYAAAGAWLAEDGVIRDAMAADLTRLNQAGIPVDVVFEQGPAVLGLD